MKASKRKKLENSGWKIGSSAEFLGLSEEEEMFVSIKLTLVTHLKARRHQLKLTQQELARRIGSSQSRIAKMEMADRSVSMELLVRTLISLGASQKKIGEIIGATAAVRKRAKTGKAKLIKS